MYFGSRKRREDQEILEQNVSYPEASIKQYLNIRRTSKDKLCNVLFCVFMLILIIIVGLGFFYGNYSNIDQFVIDSNVVTTGKKICLNSNTFKYELCSTSLCTSGTQITFLSNVCITKGETFPISSQLEAQIQMYNLRKSIDFMAYVNVAVTIGIIFALLSLICVPKLLYLYTFLSFFFLLAFSFYLLKSINVSLQSWYSQSFYDDIIVQSVDQMSSLAYILLAAYIIIFPLILFSSKKIELAVSIILNMQRYFTMMFTIIVFTTILAIATFGIIFVIALLLMNMFTAGTKQFNSTSFFYLYTDISLSHPAVLVLFFFDIYWFFGTLISWHRYMIGSSVLQWYFEDGGQLQPIRKGIRRAWNQLGSAAIDAFLSPLQWIVLFIYGLAKIQDDQEQENHSVDDCLCFSNCIYSFRKMITRLYLKMNRNSPSSGVLTNQAFLESCQISAITLSEKKHKFFNIGGTITIYLTLFSTLTFIIINYLALYYSKFLKNMELPISSLKLQIILAGFLGMVIGLIMSNIFSASVDCLLFCFLLQRKKGVEASNNLVKKKLQQLYSKQEIIEEVKEMYQIELEQQ